MSDSGQVIGKGERQHVDSDKDFNTCLAWSGGNGPRTAEGYTAFAKKNCFANDKGESCGATCIDLEGNASEEHCNISLPTLEDCSKKCDDLGELCDGFTVNRYNLVERESGYPGCNSCQLRKNIDTTNCGDGDWSFGFDTYVKDDVLKAQGLRTEKLTKTCPYPIDFTKGKGSGGDKVSENAVKLSHKKKKHNRCYDPLSTTRGKCDEKNPICDNPGQSCSATGPEGSYTSMCITCG